MTQLSSKEQSTPSLDRSLIRPFQVGEHVSCTLLPDSTAEAIVAKVVAFNDEYTDAAQRFMSDYASKVKVGPSAHGTSGSSDVHPPSPRPDSKDRHPSSPSPSEAQGTASGAEVSSTDLEEIDATEPPSSSTQLVRDPLEKRQAAADPDAKSSDDTYAQNPILVGKVYVTFPGQDHRLDRWEFPSRIERAPPPKPKDADEADENGYIRTRAMKRARDEVIPSADADIALDRRTVADYASQHEHKTVVRNVSEVFFGKYQVECWYYSPMHPPDKPALDAVYVCDLCLLPSFTRGQFKYHRRRCQAVRPPGILVYEDKSRDIRVYEVDAYFSLRFCTNLACLAKFFLEHKSLCYDVTAFYFYVLTLKGEIAGYFSKEKPLTMSPYNVACILTFPQHQRKGIGRFLIDFSYELTRREGKVGTPERPLSDLGQLSYRRHWTHAILKFLQNFETSSRTVLVSDIVSATGFCEDDIVPILKSMGLHHIWKGVNSAKVSKVALESAQAKCSPPLIPMESRFFMNKWRKKVSAEQDDAEADDTITPITTPVMSRMSTPSATRGLNGMQAQCSGLAKAPGMAKAKKSKKKSVKTEDRINGMCSQMKPVLSPVSRRDRKSDLMSQVGFTDHQMKRMRGFIRKHTPEAVSLKLDMEGCIRAELFREFSSSIGLSNSKCRKKMRKMAQAICSEQTDGKKAVGWNGNGESARGGRNGTRGENGRRQDGAGPSGTHREVEAYEEDKWYDEGSRANEGMADADLEYYVDEDMEQYTLVGSEVLELDSQAYMGESGHGVPKAPERSSRVEFVETKQRYGSQENGQLDEGGNDVVVID